MSLSILILEDIKAIAIGLQRTLTAMGHSVVVCPNGKLALEQMISKVPDLIFCDLVMPEMDGYQFTKQALHLNKQLKIIIYCFQQFN